MVIYRGIIMTPEGENNDPIDTHGADFSPRI
jgi:hypothetical protein